MGATVITLTRQSQQAVDPAADIGQVSAVAGFELHRGRAGVADFGEGFANLLPIDVAVPRFTNCRVCRT